MTRKERSAKRLRIAEEGPAPEAPEADAVEQRLPAADDPAESDWEVPPEDSFEQASEADVVEQAQEAGLEDDPDERR